MRPYHFTTGSGTPALTQIQGEAVAFLGLTATSAESATVFIKLWWGGNTVTELPVIGTTAPSVTIPLPTTGIAPTSFKYPLQGGGPCWVAVTANAVDTDDTAITGGDVITLFID